MVYRYEEKEKVVTAWAKVKAFINKQPIDNIILRKDLIHHVYKGPMPKKFNSSYGSTVDNYRKLLTILGILEYADRGQYRVKYHVREDLTTTQLNMLITNGIRI
jgi:hypothetical protein